LTVLKTRIWEPYTAYKRFVGRKKDNGIKAGFLSEKKNPSLTEKISVWIRGNFFIPDARKFWIKPSVKYLSAWLKDNPVSALVSTGPPHSMHLIAMAIHEKHHIPWLADFRDPWTNIDFYDNLMLSRKSDKKHHRLEKEVLSKADKIVVVSKGMSLGFQSVADRQYNVITNGFDDEIQHPNDVVPDNKFSLAHIGSLVPSRNPENLWKALNELLVEVKDFGENLKIKFVGAVDFSVREMLSKYRLEKYTAIIPYLPHAEVIKIQQTSQVLLLIINNTPNAKMVTTGKIFEYISSGRPVLCIGPVTGDAAGIISETNSGITLDQQDLQGIKTAIGKYYLLYKEAKLKSESKDISTYSRRNLTKKLAEILDDMIG